MNKSFNRQNRPSHNIRYGGDSAPRDALLMEISVLVIGLLVRLVHAIGRMKQIT